MVKQTLLIIISTIAFTIIAMASPMKKPKIIEIRTAPINKPTVSPTIEPKRRKPR
ncbi:MAG TPA: hypothetical protein GXZ95_05270 [Mollicutes bacterium]|nr:hypothetical protein [Mollicutes bacterium]